jgi:hypothetical protein
MPRTCRTLLPVAAALIGLAAVAHADPVFKATMDGAQVLPEPIRTSASGTIEFDVSADGKAITYRLDVNRLANASVADVHLGAASQNGPVIAKLFPNGKPPKKGEFSGVLAGGRLTAGDLIGPMAGASIAELVAEIEAGNVYVNVHSNDGVEPANSGPGDYRLGEIRGHLMMK